MNFHRAIVTSTARSIEVQHNYPSILVSLENDRGLDVLTLRDTGAGKTWTLEKVKPPPAFSLKYVRRAFIDQTDELWPFEVSALRWAAAIATAATILPRPQFARPDEASANSKARNALVARNSQAAGCPARFDVRLSRKHEVQVWDWVDDLPKILPDQPRYDGGSGKCLDWGCWLIELKELWDRGLSPGARAIAAPAHLTNSLLAMGGSNLGGYNEFRFTGGWRRRIWVLPFAANRIVDTPTRVAYARVCPVDLSREPTTPPI
jgi:hypothetical protein